jgi:endonuclease/exonuclease/phosphatase family metal-dependent hydrolase
MIVMKDRKLLKFWIDNLRNYETLKELHRSEFFAEAGKAILNFLATPQIIHSPDAIPRIRSFLRIVQWNIEKGKQIEAIVQRIQSSEVLKWADIIMLNEADLGMNRSQNRYVAREIAERLGMHMAFAPSYIELTKGIDEELLLEGENCESIQGNAILARYPILEACIVPLPVSFEPYEFHEKRFGVRHCFWVRLQLPNSTLWAGLTHLELRNSPQCRAKQMRHILEHLPGGGQEAYLLGGDLNVNSFGRGTMIRTVKSILRLLWTSPSKMKERLLHPEWGAEPLFQEVCRRGFVWEGFNSNEETARAAIGALEEAQFLPETLLNAIRSRLEPYEGYFCFKLDWLFGKNIRSLIAGEKSDNQSGISSANPGCLAGVNYGPARISDHLPVFADLDLA